VRRQVSVISPEVPPIFVVITRAQARVFVDHWRLRGRFICYIL
jgi:hypothetical protein